MATKRKKMIGAQMKTDSSAQASWIKDTGHKAPKGTYHYTGAQTREVAGRLAEKSRNPKQANLPTGTYAKGVAKYASKNTAKSGNKVQHGATFKNTSYIQRRLRENPRGVSAKAKNTTSDAPFDKALNAYKKRSVGSTAGLYSAMDVSNRMRTGDSISKRTQAYKNAGKTGVTPASKTKRRTIQEISDFDIGFGNWGRVNADSATRTGVRAKWKIRDKFGYKQDRKK